MYIYKLPKIVMEQSGLCPDVSSEWTQIYNYIK